MRREGEAARLDVRRLDLHWRPAHITRPAVDELARVLAEHPGPDDVILVVHRQRFRLGVTVDSTARGLRRAAHDATGACVLAFDSVAFPPF